MFFILPFGTGGGFFTLIFIFLLLRLIVKSLNYRNSDKKNYDNQRSYQYYYEFNQNQNPYASTQNVNLANAYSTLGVSASATNDEVKKAYRRLTLEYHPDTIEGKGLGKEFTEFATKKFREVQEAYELICKQRNIK